MRGGGRKAIHGQHDECRGSVCEARREGTTMSTPLGDILRRLALVMGATVVLLGIMMLFTYDIIKIDWVSFMEIQPSYKQMEDPRPVPERSIPIEGAVS